MIMSVWRLLDMEMLDDRSQRWEWECHDSSNYVHETNANIGITRISV
jgi:hypothetical protein